MARLPRVRFSSEKPIEITSNILVLVIRGSPPKIFMLKIKLKNSKLNSKHQGRKKQKENLKLKPKTQISTQK